MIQLDLLNKIYSDVEAVILDKQHPATGLLPASTSVNNHGDYTDAWVRDNVYSIFAVWALGKAYRRQGETERSDQLEQSTTKLMRGLLLSMMRQSHKVEAFKHSFAESDALHAKYDTATGLPVVADDAWGHLQLDATSLFLLTLAQMSASGLRIVCTFGEVDFIQNLIYYIASAYRTPDYGIWERGNKINNGKTEINASSVGMAKAALQALDGFNLFGKNASPRAVIHTVSDAISFSRNTLRALLPRESLSKEVDAALLSIIGYPAFAISDTALVEKTRNEILNKLAGNYGCKRFLWDGHQTVIEDESRLYYEHSELANFESIESEWPLFYTYLYLHALFDDNKKFAKAYREKLESLMVEVDGRKLLPELYFVAEDKVIQEKESPKSQERIPNDNIPLVWAQSLFITGLLLDENLISKDDIDPLKMRHRSRQHVKTQIALVVLAENDAVKQCLIERGVIAETLDEISPVGVISASQLVEMYSLIGRNKALGLTGRPNRRLNLATYQAYEINDQSYLCLSWLQSKENEYRNFDSQLMGENIRREMAYIKSQWYTNQAAVFTWLVDQKFCDAVNANDFFQVLRDLQLRSEYQYVGYASASLAYRAARINPLIIPDICITPFLPVSTVDLLYINEALLIDQEKQIIDNFHMGNIEKCCEILLTTASTTTLKTTLTLSDDSEDYKFSYFIEYLYQKSQRKNYWLLARACFNLLGNCHNDLADALILLAARNMSVIIDSDHTSPLIINSPLSNNEFVRQLSGLIEDPIEYAMVQEALTVIGAITRMEPDLLDGLRSINVQQLLASCVECERVKLRSNLNQLGMLAPATLFTNIYNIFVTQKEIYAKGLGESLFDIAAKDDGESDIDRDWKEWRTERGLVTHLDDSFLHSVWDSMAQATILEFGDGRAREFTIHCELIRSSMTASEVIFAQLIDGVTRHLHPLYYKSIVLEALYAFCMYCENNPAIIFTKPVYFAKLLEQTAGDFIQENTIAVNQERNIDILLRQSPQQVNHYVTQRLALFAKEQ